MSVFNFATLSILSLFPALANTATADENVALFLRKTPTFPPKRKASAMVTERWGVEGHLQHPDTLHYETQDDGKTVIRLELSALPVDVEVYRARLFFTRPGRYGVGFDIVPVERQGEARRGAPPLQLVPPYFQWFDATEVVRDWVKADSRTGWLLLRQAPDFDRKMTYLEIAYKGALISPPEQLEGMKAFYRNGQVFITFKEIEDYADGKEDVTWGELSNRFSGVRDTGPVPRDEDREVRYRIYMHDKPISAETICEARLLADVYPGSMYNTRLLPGGDFIQQRPDAVALRLAVEPGKPLPPGNGLYVHTVSQEGERYYGVVSAIDGVENTVDFSEANTVGPLEQRQETIKPVLQHIPKEHGHEHAGTTELDSGLTYHEDWYSLWAVPPQAPRPLRYDFAVGYCPRTMTNPATLTFTRGHTWGPNPEMPRPEPRRDIVMSMSTEEGNGFWTGTNDARDTLKGIEEGIWRPFTHNRQEFLIRWAQEEFPVDELRIYSAIGCWGMWEIKRHDLYAYIHGWGMPEVTKGFQCWDWARGAWGPPEAYQDKPEDENPFYLQDYTRWVLENPAKKLPYFNIHMGWGAHFTEIGWPPFPRFACAMIDTKRAFCMNSPVIGSAIEQGIIDFRRDLSVPAFGNCSLDDNIGDGNLRCSKPFGQINGYLVWESATIVDEPELYEITIYLWSGDNNEAPLDSCTVDFTPRNCQEFKLEAGPQASWSNVTLTDGKQVQDGRAAADQYGLVTIKDLVVTKDKHRIVIRRE